MKKLLSLALTCLLLVSLAACGGSSNDRGPLTGGSPASNGSNNSGSQDNDGYQEGGDWGYIGDVMHTYWFDFTVDDAYTCAEYEGYTASEGKQLVVATLSLKNTFLQSLPMSQTDFQIQWGGEGDDDYEWPISAVSEAQLPDEYTLAINESRSGVVVYEVPAGTSDFSISFGEYFEDKSEGDVYFIYFTATSNSSTL